MLSDIAPPNVSEELLSYVLYKECDGNLEEAAIYVTANDMGEVDEKMRTAKKKQLEKENLEKKRLQELEKKEQRILLDKYLVVGESSDGKTKKSRSKVAKEMRREQRKAQMEKEEQANDVLQWPENGKRELHRWRRIIKRRNGCQPQPKFRNDFSQIAKIKCKAMNWRVVRVFNLEKEDTRLITNIC